MTAKQIALHLSPALLRVPHAILVKDVMQVYGVGRWIAEQAIWLAMRKNDEQG